MDDVGQRFETPQEKFWSGEFGNEYIERNQGAQVLSSKVSFFAEVLSKTGKIKSVCELGANIGLNLRAIRLLMPDVKMSAVEINSSACEQLRELDCEVFQDSILNVDLAPSAFDLVFTSGVLIHINPEYLSDVFRSMASSSRRFVLISEYYNPTPVTVSYRGHEDRLFKRDFAGEFLDSNPDFELRSYGFRYHRDAFPADDLTWFLMERN